MALATEDAATEDRLRQLGAEADRTDRPSEFQVGEQSESQTDPAEASTPDTPEEVQPPATGDKPSKPESTEADADTAPEKPLTPYQKEQKRRAEAWQKIEAEKASLKAEREALQKQREEREPPQSFKDQRGYTAADYETAAAQADEEGDAEMAKQLRTAGQQVRVEEFRSQWRSNFEESSKGAGLFDVLKDGSAQTPEVKQFTELLNSVPELLKGHPLGAKLAVRLYVAERDAASASALKVENERLTKENKSLNEKLSIPRSGPASVSNSNESAKDKTEKDLLRLAEEYDETAVA